MLNKINNNKKNFHIYSTLVFFHKMANINVLFNLNVRASLYRNIIKLRELNEMLSMLSFKDVIDIPFGYIFSGN